MGLVLGRPKLHEKAGKLIQGYTSADALRLVGEYRNPAQIRRSDFAIAGLRGTPGKGTFTRAHMIATVAAEIKWREANHVTGPVLVTRDENPLSLAAFQTAIEVFVANGVPVIIQEGAEFEDQGYTATPVASFTIVNWNRTHDNKMTAFIASASHNPWGQGGAKFNPVGGGPVNADDRRYINAKIDQLITSGDWKNVLTMSFEQAIQKVTKMDLVRPYVVDLAKAINFEAIRQAGKIAIDTLGGTALDAWLLMQEMYDLTNVTLLRIMHDPLYTGLYGDWDGVGRGDPSSRHATAGVIQLMAEGIFDMAGMQDRDADRCALATKTGLMTPNEFFSVLAFHLFNQHKDTGWQGKTLGKTVVSTMMLYFVAQYLGIAVEDMPVGFQNYNPGFASGRLAFAMEESAGGTTINPDGSLSSTDKDGHRMLLLGFMLAQQTGRTPAELYEQLTAQFGKPYFERLDGRVDETEADILAGLTPSDIFGAATSLAGMQITEVIDRAPGNNELIGGIKVTLNNGKACFTLRPSGTERGIVRLYVETMEGEAHFNRLVSEISTLISTILQDKQVA